MTSRRMDRRAVCRGLVATGATVLAGCLGSEENEEAEDEHTTAPALDFGSVALSDGTPIRLHLPEDEGVAAQYHFDAHWHCLPVLLPYETEYTLLLVVNGADGEPIDLGPDGPLQIGYRFSEKAADQPFSVAVEEDRLTFVGESRGTSNVIVDLKRDGEVVWSPPPLEMKVVDEADVLNKC